MLWCVASREDQRTHAMTTPHHDVFPLQEVFFSQQNRAAIDFSISITIRFDFIFYIYVYLEIYLLDRELHFQHTHNTFKRIVYCFVTQSNIPLALNAIFDVDLAHRWFFITIVNIPVFEKQFVNALDCFSRIPLFMIFSGFNVVLFIMCLTMCILHILQ